MLKLIKVGAFLLILLAGRLPVKAAKVDTVETYSASMHKKIKAVIIKPDSYDKRKAMPVVYLLHGYGSIYADWVKNVPVIKEIADDYNMILVCPDGAIYSWYVDSPINPQMRYETYVSNELVDWVDSHYKTIKNRTGRAITGFSMGGHGALYLSFRHQDIYGAAGSTSGGVDIRPFPDNWRMAEVLGTEAEHPENWEKTTVVNLVPLLKPGGRMALIIDCGTQDFFYKVNMNLHDLLLSHLIPHDFIIRPGGHDWHYWTNSIKYQLLYFHEYFIAQNKFD